MGLFLPTSPSLCFAFTHAHSLPYNFTINPQPRPGQPWCEVQGQVDREVFLSMTVVLLTSHSRVPWENSGAEVPAGDQPRLIQGIRRRDGVGEDQETIA